MRQLLSCSGIYINKGVVEIALKAKGQFLTLSTRMRDSFISLEKPGSETRWI